MPQPAYILFGSAWTVSVCLLLGRMLLRRLRVPLYRQEEHGLAFVTGAACLSGIVFVLATLGLIYKGTVLAVGALVWVAAWRSGALRARGDRLPPLPRRLAWFYGAIAALFTLLYFFHAMAPEMSPDGSAYHLGLVARYYRERGFQPITNHMYANLSQGVELLFLFAYAFGRHSGAALVHFSFSLALPWMMLSYARRFGFPLAGMAGAMFLYLSPVVGIDGASAYNDVAVAAVLFAVFHLVAVWDQTRSSSLLVPIGLTAGFAFAAKYTAFLAVPYALGRIAWALRGLRWRALRPLLIVSLCALVLIVPWLAKNWIWVENPFSPFFNRLFPNPHVLVKFEDEYRHHMQNYDGISSRWQIPLEVTIRGHLLCGLLGPLFLLVPAALLALGDRQGRRLLLAGFLFGSVYFTNIGTRFLIPPLPYFALSMALVAARLPWLVVVLVAAHAFSAWPSVLKNYCARYAWRLEQIQWRPALRLESEDEFLRRKWFNYAVARMIEERVPPGGKVLTFNQAGEAYTSREILVVYQAAANARLGDILWTPLIPQYQPNRWLEFRFEARPLRRLRVVQTKAHYLDNWSITEFRVWSGGKEVPRSPRWRIRAHPRPWDVQDAFDNSPVTRWRSGEPLFPGMFVEVDLGRERPVDTVVLETATDEYNSAVRLEASSDGKTWATIADSPVEREAPPPFGLRRMAAEELKARGVRYLLLHEGDFATPDLLTKGDAWGVQLAGETYRSYLFYIE